VIFMMRAEGSPNYLGENLMFVLKRTAVAAALALSTSLAIAASAQADPMVTYTWTTTSEGFGLHLGEPTTASFQAPLADVLTGQIPQFHITNIQLAYPGLNLDTFVVSSIGFDFAIFVDPTTGALVYHDNNQGVAVVGQDSTDPNFSTFLSILVDNPVGGAVKDQYNALDHGTPAAGFPTAGFWTATLPVTGGGGIPEPATWAMMLTGFGALGAMMRRRPSRALA
jgi:hypothetical protein